MRDLTVKQVSEYTREMIQSSGVTDIQCPDCGKWWIIGEYSPGDPGCLTIDGDYAKIYEVLGKSSKDKKVNDVSATIIICKCGRPLNLDISTPALWIRFDQTQINNY